MITKIDFKEILKAILHHTIGFLFGFFAQSEMRLDDIVRSLFQVCMGVSLTAFFVAVFFAIIRWVITGK